MENGSEMSYEQVFSCIFGLKVKNALINRAQCISFYGSLLQLKCSF